MRQAGYALIVILLLLALMLISLSVAVQPVLRAAQREKEEELIFRGEQYQRAIGRFYRKFGRYPLKVDELIRTNDRNFLRHAFPDPITPDGKWRLIRLGPSGQLIGSKNQTKAEAQAGGPPQKATGGGTGPSSGMSSGGVSYPIIGVASTSTDIAIRIYDGYARYDEWEFIYDPTKEAFGKVPGAGAAPGAGAGSTDNSKNKPKTTN